MKDGESRKYKDIVKTGTICAEEADTQTAAAALAVFAKTLKKAADARKSGYIFIMTTEELEIRRASDGCEAFTEEDINKLYKYGLEIRIFDKDGEMKLFRARIGRDFRLRDILNDEEVRNNELICWREEQFLDIDDTKSKPKEGKAAAIGGGTYSLPIDNYKNAKIGIINYLDEEEETGALYVCDWRLADFITGKGE